MRRQALTFGAVVLAAMATGRAVTDLIPVNDVVAAPFFHDAGVGAPITLSMASVEVTGVRVGPLVTGRSAAKAGGRWLVVDTRLTATRQPTILFATLIDRSGRHHFAANRAEDCITNGALPTGVPWHGSFCFDVDKRALDGATLLVHRGDYGDEGDGFRRDDVARIDLGIDDVDTLWKGTAPVDVEESDTEGGKAP